MKKLNISEKNKNILTWCLMYLCLFMLIEAFQRSSLLQAVTYIFQHPLISLYNMSIIVCLSCFILLLKRKKLGFVIYSILWAILSCASGIKSVFRGDPLMAQDFFLIKEAGDVANSYLSGTKMILIGVLIIASIFVLVYTWKNEKTSVRFSNKVFTIISLALVLAFPFLSKGIVQALNIKPVLWDMRSSYYQFGFAYSFGETVTSLKPSKPDTYSKDKIESIKNEISTEVMAKVEETSKAKNIISSDVKPNVIGFLLEAFFDPTTLPGVKFSRDPIPNFRALSQKYSSGKMTVPVIGGGTVNTEFEAFTAMSTKLLSPGNTPYVQTLRTKSVESVASVLRDNGYTTTAIHDHWGNFYNRVDVYKNIGFDRFISGETIPYKTHSGEWEEDKVMLDPISKVLSQKEDGNYIFGVTVQTHGPYDGTKLISEDGPKVVEGPLNENEKIQLENYAYQLEQADKFIKSVVDLINSTGKPTILYMYGDHLPALGNNFSVYDKVKLTDTQKFATPYLIWDNIGLKKNDEDIKAYQLSPKIFDILNLKGTTMAQFQRKYKQGNATEEEFKLMEYDLLYGKDYTYTDSKPFEIKDMTIGLIPLTVTSVEIKDDKVVIKGTGFTEQSRVLRHNKIIDTTFVDTTTLEVAKDSVKSGDSIEACYIDWKNGVYTKSPTFSVK